MPDTYDCPTCTNNPTYDDRWDDELRRWWKMRCGTCGNTGVVHYDPETNPDGR